MFDSLKPWMKYKLQVRPFEGYTPSADKRYGDPVDILGYIVGSVETITDAVGEDVVSSTQVYFEPDKYKITPLDNLIVDGEEKGVIQITNYVDGNDGKSSIKIAYL